MDWDAHCSASCNSCSPNNEVERTDPASTKEEARWFSSLCPLTSGIWLVNGAWYSSSASSGSWGRLVVPRVVIARADSPDQPSRDKLCRTTKCHVLTPPLSRPVDATAHLYTQTITLTYKFAKRTKNSTRSHHEFIARIRTNLLKIREQYTFSH